MFIVMKRFVFVALLSLVLLMSGCSGREEVIDPVSNPTAKSASSVGSGSTLKPASTLEYAEYSEGILDSRRPLVLFLAQNADVFSQRSDRLLKQLYGSGAAKISTYRLDAGTATGMKLTYNVLLPDTFVVVSSSGMIVSSILHPNALELNLLITKSPQ